MTMTVDEIVMEYKQAKDPEKQIHIIADQCLCKPSDIRTILKEAGVYVSKAGRPKKRPSAPEPAEVQAEAAELKGPKLEDIRPVTVHQEPEGFTVSVDRRSLTPDLDELLMKGLEDQPHVERCAPSPLPLYDIKDIKASALDAIADMFPYDADEGEVFNFTERVRGVLIFVLQLEGWSRP